MKKETEKKGILKKVLVWGGSIFLLLVAVLSVHIYMVTRPKAPDTTMRIMARVDFTGNISPDDAAKITSCLYQQKGIDHVLCNPKSKIAVFTFFPAKASAEQIITGLNTTLPYNGKRFLPSPDQIKSGCPVAATSMTYKAYEFFNHLF
jgi:hypothetical protein